MLILREDVASIEDSSWAADWKGDKRYDPLTRQLQAPRRNFTQLNFTSAPRLTRHSAGFDSQGAHSAAGRTNSHR